MITYSGVHIQKIGGECGTPTATDIAVHAGRICRFGGAVWYPLLPHLVFVGLMAYKRSGSVANLLWGFLHDAHEVATSDVPRPFKCDCLKTEQSAIDDRLIERYCDTLWAAIDHDLIKKCDHDACDIEAVELRLPNFADIEMRHTQDYRNRDAIYTDAGDVELFRRINSRSFGINTHRGTSNLGVVFFKSALERAEAGDYDEFLEEVKGWNLL